MTTPEGVRLLKRITELEQLNMKRHASHHYYTAFNMHLSRYSVKETIEERYHARVVSAKLFKDFIRTCELEAVALHGHTHDRTAEHTEWLAKFEDEISEDEAFVYEYYNSTDPSCVHEDRQQLTGWNAEIATRKRRWSAAIKLVLKFKAKEHVRRTTRVADTMNRLVSLNFPAELRIKLIEAAIESQVGRWNVKEEHGINTVAAGFFAWPDSVSHDTRSVLEQMVADLLLKSSIIEIPAAFTDQLPRAYEIPPALVGKERNVRRLVLDLQIPLIGKSYNVNLNNSIRAMESLGKAFPYLAVCVFLLRVEFNEYFAGQRPAMSLEDAILSVSNFKRQRTVTPQGIRTSIVAGTLKETFVDFIATFARSGPGKRKLIRFSKEKIESYGKAAPDSPGPETRPLTRVTSPAVVSAADTPEETLANEDNESMINARRILDQAYRGLWTLRPKSS